MSCMNDTIVRVDFVHRLNDEHERDAIGVDVSFMRRCLGLRSCFHNCPGFVVLAEAEI